MPENPLQSLDAYSRFVAELLAHRGVERSTVTIWSDSRYTGIASSFPHHRHLPPDIKHHRIPAPGMSFLRPNLGVLVLEIVDLSPA